ncbi:hypothetical protein [Pelagovum pacificum]|uniref:PH domain-containing protein n=1 Tax=Pelagovum pacificum TaxID=2588711 RepID=A0A5C5GFV8_9RHOB|nr:hypothetical protein [Pelagovum pacificum]QQA43225.1 hypothetical protein I8N54_01235 [Pelagovum pacificum]TNY33635.1 hypothetical protein FHY64_10285 [Pelagovum pacificum]
MSEALPDPEAPDLAPDERLLQSFAPDPAVYTRDHAWLAVLAAALSALSFWLVWRPLAFAGPPVAILIVAARHKSAADRDMTERWHLTDRRLVGPGGQEIELKRIDKLRPFGSAVQVTTNSGSRHLVRFQRKPRLTLERIEAARDA